MTSSPGAADLPELPASRTTPGSCGPATCTRRCRAARVHGARFCADAAAAGAVAVLTDADGRERAVQAGLPVFVVADPRARLGEVAAWIYGYPSEQLLLIGVTGTSGKTTSTFLLESGLRAAGYRTGLIGGVADPDRRPDAAQRADHAGGHRPAGPAGRDGRARGAGRRRWRCPATRWPWAGSRAPATTSRYSPTCPRTTWTSTPAWTTTSRPRPSCSRPGYAGAGVVNIDDPRGRELAAEPQLPITTFSAEGRWPRTGGPSTCAPARTAARSGSSGPAGWRPMRQVALPGAFNVANALGAIVALVEAGIGLATAVAGVAACPGVPGRLERVEAGQDFTVLVDYSHKPGAVEAVLTGAAPGHPGQPDDRARLRRGPGHRQAPADGRGGGPAGRHRDLHQRQPALGGPAGHPGRDAGRARSRCRHGRARAR